MKNNFTHQSKYIKKIKKLIFFNPYKPISKIIGFLFWPLTFLPWIKRDILPILKLINDLFVNSKVASFLAFWYPLILITILGRVGSAHFIITGITSIVPVIIGLQVMPPIIISLRNSSILKRIGATNTKTSDLSISIIFYFSIISIISSIINASIGYLIFSNDIHFALFNWGQYFIANLIGIIISMSIGMLVASYLRKEQTAMLVGLILTLPGAFLSAQFLSPSIINDWGPIRYISFIFPQKIVVVLSYAATNKHSIFDINNVITTDFSAVKEAKNIVENLKTNGIITTEQFPTYDRWLSQLENKFEVVDKTEMLIAWILAPIQIVIFSTLSSFTFRWGVR